MKKVKVIKNVCIGYGGKAHNINDVFEVDEFHFNNFIKQGIVEELKEEIEEVKPKKKSRKK